MSTLESYLKYVYIGVLSEIRLPRSPIWNMSTVVSKLKYVYLEVLSIIYLPGSPIWNISTWESYLKYVYRGFQAEIYLPGSPIYNISTWESYLQNVYLGVLSAICLLRLLNETSYLAAFISYITHVCSNLYPHRTSFGRYEVRTWKKTSFKRNHNQRKEHSNFKINFSDIIFVSFRLC